MAQTNDPTDKNFSPLVFIMLIMMSIGIVWLATNDIAAGMTHIIIFLTATALISLSLLFIDESSKTSVFRLIGLPFRVSIFASSALYFLGILIPIIFSFLGFNTSKIIIPLAAKAINLQMTQSFAAVQIVLDDFWRWFVTVYTSGTNEEFVFAFVAIMLGIIITDYLIQAFKFDIKFEKKTPYLFAGGMIFSIILFTGIHILNASYTTISMFVIAALFRLVLNISIYYFGLALSFSIGFHQSNNAVWFFNEYGAATTLSALSGTGGILIIIFNLIILVTIFSGIKELSKIKLFRAEIK